MDVNLKEFKCAIEKGGGQVPMKIAVYPAEQRDNDIISDSFYLEQVREEFGMRHLRGTAIAFYNPDTHYLYSTEELFASYFKGKKYKHIVEIGTWRGVSTAMLAHHAEKVTTIDISYYPEALPVWYFFGVKDKIKYVVVENNEAKRKLIDTLDFDFAFVDGNHDFNEVAFDYECVKKCGRILFHDYGVRHLPDITKFVDRLKNVKTRRMPFAYWEANGSIR